VRDRLFLGIDHSAIAVGDTEARGDRYARQSRRSCLCDTARPRRTCSADRTALTQQREGQCGGFRHPGPFAQGRGHGTERRQRLAFADGTSLETDLVVFSAGIRPRDELARAAGLAIGERGGIQIDSRCRTSNPDIYAIGECALWQGRIFGLVAPGYQMAEVAARNLAGEDVQFLGADMSTKLKLMGVDVASIGDAHGATPDSLNYVFTDEATGVYKKLVVKDKRLLGTILLGDTSDYGALLQLMLNGVPLRRS